MEELVFDDLEPIAVPVKYKGRSYVLKEPSTPATKKWRNACIKCGRRDAKGNVTSLEGLADTESLLVSLCLFTSDDKPVSVAELDTWPPRVLKRLFNEAVKIGQLEEADLTEAQLEDRIEAHKEELKRRRGAVDPTTANDGAANPADSTSTS